MTHLLTALGEPARMEIIALLAQQGRTNVGDIASNFRLSRPTISHHLKVLKDAGIVQSEKQGQETYYWLDRDFLITGLEQIVEALKGCWSQGDGVAPERP
jgi:DNA-binding transcriptional ArsR family regulator